MHDRFGPVGTPISKAERMEAVGIYSKTRARAFKFVSRTTRSKSARQFSNRLVALTLPCSTMPNYSLCPACSAELRTRRWTPLACTASIKGRQRHTYHVSPSLGTLAGLDIWFSHPLSCLLDWFLSLSLYPLLPLLVLVLGRLYVAMWSHIHAPMPLLYERYCLCLFPPLILCAA